MPLTDTKIKALFAKAQRGESAGKESDGEPFVLRESLLFSPFLGERRENAKNP